MKWLYLACELLMIVISIASMIRGNDTIAVYQIVLACYFGIQVKLEQMDE